MRTLGYRRLSRVAWLLAALAAVAPAPILAADAPGRNPVVDLRAHDAGANRAVFLVLFSLPDCVYCESVRNAYLPGVAKDERYRGRVLVREVVVGSDGALIDLRGERTTHAEFARSHRVQFAPTVLFLDGSNRALADPLVGGDVSGFYWGYLEQRVSQALAAVDSSGGSGGAAPSTRR